MPPQPPNKLRCVKLKKLYGSCISIKTVFRNLISGFGYQGLPYLPSSICYLLRSTLPACPLPLPANYPPIDLPTAATETAYVKVQVEREQDGRWIAEVPVISGAMAYGTTRDEAVAKVEALVLRILADRLEHGEPSPEVSEVFSLAA